MNTYTLDVLTELRVLTTLRIRIYDLVRRRNEAKASISLAFANSWFNKDIREAIDTYRKFQAAEQHK
jgi:hypothetical protein